MSASRNTHKKVRLIADASEPGTEIFVIDGGFNRVGKGLDTLDMELSPGLYKVKFKRGSLVSEVDTTLFPQSGVVEVHAPDMPFYSPAPLHGTSTSHEYHQDEAKRLSLEVHKQLGRNSQLFVFVRDIQPGGRGNPALGLSLHDLRGHMLVDFSKVVTRCRGDQAGDIALWAGCNIELDPGEYRLRVNTEEEGRLEQILVLSPGWQTQLFLTRNWNWHWQKDKSLHRPSEKKQWLSLSKSTILMARMGEGFDAFRNKKNLALTELTRQGLTSGRTVVRAADLQRMLNEKFQNPMLGIYGLHILLRAIDVGRDKHIPAKRRSDESLLQAQLLLGVNVDGVVGPRTMQVFMDLLHTVIGNLKHLLGDHSDVRALDFWPFSRY